jgi:phosphatidylserine synthase 2
MHTYDDDCTLTYKNVTDNIDHYFLMHWVGWFIASLTVRNIWILNIWSILDELLELSWQHILPHFRECWWDHLLVDLVLANTPAILLGIYVSKKLGLEQYDWLGKDGQTSILDWKCWQWCFY